MKKAAFIGVRIMAALAFIIREMAAHSAIALQLYDVSSAARTRVPANYPWMQIIPCRYLLEHGTSFSARKSLICSRARSIMLR